MSVAVQRPGIILTILGCFGAGSLYGWSGYLSAVRTEFGVGNAAASMVFSLALASFTTGVLLGPMLLARIPGRFRLPLLAGLASLSLGLSAINTGLTGFALAYGLSFGFLSGALYNHTVSIAATSSRATLLVPVSVAVFGLGGAVFGPVQVSLTAAGWGLWSIAPALGCLAAVAGAAVILDRPAISDVSLFAEPLAMTRPNRTIAALWVIFAAGSGAGLIVLGFAAQFLPKAGAGFGLSGLAIFVAAIGNTLGRLSATLTAGRFGPANGIAGALTLSMSTLVCLLFTTAPLVVVGLLFLVALAYGQLAATMPLLVKSLVTGPAFPSSFGWVFTGWGVAGLLGPWTAGWVLDATGTFRLSLIICIALAALGLWLVLRLAQKGTAQQKH